jgi:MinD superfamily P-loop ATPase
MEGIKEIVVVSGKGGTGKTSITLALASLFQDKVVVDCDVDAANLHIVLWPPEIVAKKEFTGGKKAKIDLNICNQCGICREMCRYNAISAEYKVDPVMCEGCGTCFFFCPQKAVDFSSRVSGYYYISKIASNDPFIFAELIPGEENSGKLVALVKNEARELAKSSHRRLILVDGPPGIGCPVISSLTGSNFALIVTEPTPSGEHDLKRIVELAHHFKIRAGVVVNKSDLNPYYVKLIQEYCEHEAISFLGKIPYDVKITEAQRNLMTILEFAPECESSRAIKTIHNKLERILEEL